VTDLVRPLQPASTSGSAGVDGYPERIGHQWWIRDLPSSPGPMAGLMDRYSPGSVDGWFAIAESGRLWRLPSGFRGMDEFPTISRSGRYISYLRARTGPSVIQDLVTGDETSFASIGSSTEPIRTRYTLNGQTPGLWSPDGKQLLVFAAGTRHRNVNALVLGLDGTVRVLSNEGYSAGWVSNDEIAWLSGSQGRRGSTSGPAEVQITNAAGQVEHVIALSTRLRDARLDQWSSAVSPDGSRLLIVTNYDIGGSVVRTFSLSTGKALTSPALITNAAGTCSPGWTGSLPVVPVVSYDSHDGDTAYPVVVGDTGTRRLVAVEPGLGSQCTLWAADALSGPAHGGMFGLLGTSTAWWTWWWRELLLGLAVLVAAGWAIRRWVRRVRPLPDPTDT
jgi:hypothetical protein